jgi:hypothetical protein
MKFNRAIILRRARLTVLVWAGASLFFTAVLMVSDLGGHKTLSFALYANAVHFALWTLALPVLSRCTRAFPIRHGKIWNIAVIVPVVAVVGAAVTWSLWAIVFSTYFPYRSAYPNLRSLFQSELVRFLPVDILIGIVLVLALEGWRVWQQFQTERTRAIDLERKLAVARLDALRMQLHPHFLFNTLHAIAGLIVEQPPTARRMVVALGDLLRLTLKQTGGTVRSLAEELEFADLYLGIEKLRLSDRLVVDYDIEPEATSAEVPQLLLQPLFENAVRHGAARTQHPCEIHFRAYRQGNKLHLSLVNGGPVCFPSSPPPFGVGLTNTMDRLHLHYHDQFSFEYVNQLQGGVKIDISIPFRKADDEIVNRSEDRHATNSTIYTHSDR